MSCVVYGYTSLPNDIQFNYIIGTKRFYCSFSGCPFKYQFGENWNSCDRFNAISSHILSHQPNRMGFTKFCVFDEVKKGQPRGTIIVKVIFNSIEISS